MAPEKIHMESISKRYSEHEVLAVDQVSLTVAEGELLCLMGPSGCGKSTLLNLIGGIDRPSQGRILIDGEDIARYNDRQLTDLRRHHVGFVFQFFNLISTLTVAENVALPLELTGQGANGRVQEVLAQVDMAHRSDFYPSQLSGGQMQRVAIARALINRPDILIADEPTGNLDTENGKKVMDLLTRLSQEHGLTMILATHSDEAAAFAHRTLHMRDGKLLDEAR